MSRVFLIVIQICSNCLEYRWNVYQWFHFTARPRNAWSYWNQKMLWLVNGAYNTETGAYFITLEKEWQRLVYGSSTIEGDADLSELLLDLPEPVWLPECIPNILYWERRRLHLLISQFYVKGSHLSRMLLEPKCLLLPSHFSLGRSREGGMVGGSVRWGCARGGGSTLSPQFHSTVECVIPRALIPTVYLF